MNFVCSLNFVDVNILVYLVRRPCTAGIVSFKEKKSKTTKICKIEKNNNNSCPQSRKLCLKISNHNSTYLSYLLQPTAQEHEAIIEKQCMHTLEDFLHAQQTFDIKQVGATK